MNAAQPYGAWTRPYYLGESLASRATVFQIGFDTSDVKYGSSFSTYTKSIPAYMRAIRTIASQFKPDVIYTHETFPAVAGYIGANMPGFYPKSARLIFDMHALHAAEYKAMINFYPNKARGIFLYYKSFLPQRFIAKKDVPIIAASVELKTMLREWYGVNENRVKVVPNGAPPKFVAEPRRVINPYQGSYANALLVAPKNMMPNELAVQYIGKVAQQLSEIAGSDKIRIVVVGGGWKKEEVEINPNILYSGFVEDLMAYIDFADICLLPFPVEAVCGGARNKALDYFSRGRCVLSTEEGLRGLTDFKNGEHVYISSYDPACFARILFERIQQKDANGRIGENARNLVINSYSWDISAKRVMDKFEEILKND